MIPAGTAKAGPGVNGAVVETSAGRKARAGELRARIMSLVAEYHQVAFPPQH
jgi:hypothetical protein